MRRVQCLYFATAVDAFKAWYGLLVRHVGRLLGAAVCAYWPTFG